MSGAVIRANVEEALSALGRRFHVILADPPWLFGHYSDEWHRKHRGQSRAVFNRYECMSDSQLCALPVADVAEPDALLFLWATGPKLESAFEVMRSWGFAYKALGFAWIKTTAAGVPYMGMGHYTRGNAELVLIGRRGRGVPRRDAGVRQVLLSRRRGHSEKPVEIHRRIERLVEGPYLELFAREGRAGWTCVGDQCQQAMLGMEEAGRW